MVKIKLNPQPITFIEVLDRLLEFEQQTNNSAISVLREYFSGKWIHDDELENIVDYWLLILRPQSSSYEDVNKYYDDLEVVDNDQ